MNLANHSGMRSLQRTTCSASQNETILLQQKLDAKNQESMLRQWQLDIKAQEVLELCDRVDVMRLQHLKSQTDKVKASQRCLFKHRLCSLSILSVQVGSEVYIESYGYGRVESTIFLYNKASIYWLLVSGVDCFLVAKLEGSVAEGLRIKFGSLVRDGNPKGYAVWTKASAAT
jgi:hypothetical protein